MSTRTLITTRELAHRFAVPDSAPLYIEITPGATADYDPRTGRTTYDTFIAKVKGITPVPHNLPRSYPLSAATDYEANKDRPDPYHGPHPELYHIEVVLYSSPAAARAGAIRSSERTTVFVFNADHNPWDAPGEGPQGKNNYVTVIGGIHRVDLYEKWVSEQERLSEESGS